MKRGSLQKGSGGLWQHGSQRAPAKAPETSKATKSLN